MVGISHRQQRTAKLKTRKVRKVLAISMRVLSTSSVMNCSALTVDGQPATTHMGISKLMRMGPNSRGRVFSKLGMVARSVMAWSSPPLNFLSTHTTCLSFSRYSDAYVVGQPKNKGGRHYEEEEQEE